MDTAKNLITPSIKEQILKVRAIADINMFDCPTVASIAKREGWYELVGFLSDIKNWDAYDYFILNSKMDEAR